LSKILTKLLNLGCRKAALARLHFQNAAPKPPAERYESTAARLALETSSVRAALGHPERGPHASNFCLGQHRVILPGACARSLSRLPSFW
jgi:hypothetical protein